ncbi:sigma-70 family RNA polymerase sigma factor [Edaphobacter bradus]|uniref:sigma-70 family RNA polymerase sigma factor n=1 Tax=Edaphobacter bradus TaxID=2259016 RepID=UPI0021DFF1DE|nr:sigma-70 family RNA polymerase sigma factor [Edaphobacter bradus]
MLAVEGIPPSFPSSTDQDMAQIVHARRRELTSLMLAEKSYFERIATAILRNATDAEDVVQTSFCAAWKAIAAFRGESLLKTWFTRIVTNHAILALRKMGRGKLVSIEDDPKYLQSYEQASSSAVDDPEKIIVRREALNLIHRHIEHLPEETRIVFILHFSNDCSIERIAELRGKSYRAVISQLHRGKALLRKRVRKVPASRVIVQHTR